MYHRLAQRGPASASAGSSDCTGQRRTQSLTQHSWRTGDVRTLAATSGVARFDENVEPSTLRAVRDFHATRICSNVIRVKHKATGNRCHLLHHFRVSNKRALLPQLLRACAEPNGPLVPPSSPSVLIRPFERESLISENIDSDSFRSISHVTTHHSA